MVAVFVPWRPVNRDRAPWRRRGRGRRSRREGSRRRSGFRREEPDELERVAEAAAAELGHLLRVLVGAARSGSSARGSRPRQRPGPRARGSGMRASVASSPRSRVGPPDVREDLLQAEALVCAAPGGSPPPSSSSRRKATAARHGAARGSIEALARAAHRACTRRYLAARSMEDVLELRAARGRGRRRRATPTDRERRRARRAARRAGRRGHGAEEVDVIGRRQARRGRSSRSRHSRAARPPSGAARGRAGPRRGSPRLARIAPEGEPCCDRVVRARRRTATRGAGPAAQAASPS